MSPILRIGLPENGGGGGLQPAAPKGPPAYAPLRPIEEMTWAQIHSLDLKTMARLYRSSTERTLKAHIAGKDASGKDIERMLNILRHYLAELMVQAIERGQA